MGGVDCRLFHSDSVTVSQCDHFLLLHVFVSCLLFETLHDITKLKSFFVCLLGEGGGGALIYSVFNIWCRILI